MGRPKKKTTEEMKEEIKQSKFIPTMQFTREIDEIRSKIRDFKFRYHDWGYSHDDTEYLCIWELLNGVDGILEREAWRIRMKYYDDLINHRTTEKPWASEED